MAENTWTEIRSGVSEVEKLIGQKQYNMAMIKARQTLETMVGCLADNSGIKKGELAATIENLYRSRVITQTTYEHYNRIRIIGTKAERDGDTNASGANTAYHLLSQELYTFANDVRSGRRSGTRTASGRRPGGKKRKARLSPIGILFIAACVVILALIVFGAVRLFSKKGKEKEKKEPSTAATMQITVAEIPETTAFVPVMPTQPAETEPEKEWYTTADLNVRKGPGKNEERIAVFPAGSVIDYVGDYDDEWAIVNYEGNEAYVAKQYIGAREKE